MDDRLDRRAFLATTTAVTAALAGCTLGGGGDRTTTGSTSATGTTTTDAGTATTTSTATETEATTETTTETTEEKGKPGRIVPPAIDYGELVDDFSSERWYGLRDETITLDREEAISGKYALRVENSGSRYSTIGFAPSPSLSLKGRNFSMAVKVDSPVGGRIEVRFQSPDSEHRYVSTRRLPPSMSDWMRIDFGITRGWHDPDLSSIDEIRVGMVGPKGSDVRYWIDDVRTTKSAGTPDAIVALYGGLESHYEKAYPRLKERGWTAAVPVRPATIGTEGHMSLDQLRELRDAGWDICSFPLRSSPLPEMSAKKQREVITADQRSLEKKGFTDGARHFFAPYNSIDGNTVEILRDVHDTGYVYGGSSVGVPPTAPYTIPTINGNDYASSHDVVLRANKHDQLVVLGIDDIGGDGMSVEDFEAQLDRIENNDYAGGLNVVTPSEVASGLR